MSKSGYRDCTVNNINLAKYTILLEIYIKKHGVLINGYRYVSFTEIHKNTSFQHPDRKELEASIKTLEDVMSAMNEDKMRTERMCVVFDVYNLTDKCPVS